MNSTERLKALMAGEPVDRPGISTYELVAYEQEDFATKDPSYAKLMQHITSYTDCMYRTSGVMGANVLDVEEAVTEWREGESTLKTIVMHTARGDLTQRFRRDDNIHTTWVLEHLLKTIDDIDAYLSIPWSTTDPSPEAIIIGRQRLGDTAGIVKTSVSDPICEVASLFEFGEFTVLACTETDRILALMDTIHERNMVRLRALCEMPEAGGLMVRICGPEYCTPPFLPPSMFDRFVGVYLDEMIDVMKRANMFARLHCHGKIGKVIDRIVATGAQAIDPCEPIPDGDISLAELRKQYPKLLLMGGIELKDLESGTPEGVKTITRECLDQAASGPYILMPTAAPINSPLAAQTESNYMTMIDTFHEWVNQNT